MKYITGIHALNLRCSLETGGDWHCSGIQWEKPAVRESDGSVFGEFGIETNDCIPENPGRHFVANHIRALLDLISEGAFGYAQGMRNDFICNDGYNGLIFRKVILLRERPGWNEVSQFMGREYGVAWLNFLRGSGNA